MLPLRWPNSSCTYESWTLLAALAAQTERLRLGLLVTSNRIRPPAVLGKIATTTHQPSGAGGIVGENPAIAEYEAYGLTLVPPAEGIARLTETVDILRRMWTQDDLERSRAAAQRRRVHRRARTRTGRALRGHRPGSAGDPRAPCRSLSRTTIPAPSVRWSPSSSASV
ncbi:LLM class flavin-dependent oxidoreductase [Streptomyces sp. R35]|uniref:LLM class flavin-dependent oxidoreductase n=1 Tax=Streptomyces sp. R35 TaxID=3238630 RepID=A0AB39SP11_9ACTN